MAKFKVGDKVRVIDNPERMKKYYNIGSTTFDDFTESMLDLRGKVLTIRIIHSNGKYAVDENSHNWTDEMFSGLATEQPRREFIVLRRDGAKTIAELRHDREVIKSAKATCAPSDTFDFETGAKIAFDRLMGRQIAIESNTPAPAPEPPEFYTGRVKLAKSCGCYECDHIIGKVFEISEGKFTGFVGAWGQPFSSFSDFVSKRHNKNWIEVKD